jgi:hypothetical protein
MVLYPVGHKRAQLLFAVVYKVSKGYGLFQGRPPFFLKLLGNQKSVKRPLLFVGGVSYSTPHAL